MINSILFDVTTTPVPISQILSGASDVTSSFLDTAGSFVEFIASHPITLIPIILGFVWGGVRLVGKYVRR